MTDTLSANERAKRAAAARALDFVESGMRLGLGTGSTAAWLVKLLGEKVRAGRLDVTCVPTSSRTRDLAEECGVRVTTLDELGWLDLTIDGADEFDPELRLIKGGGGALLQEKIVATASDKMIVISDPAKEVERLGAFPLPVEIVRFGWQVTKTIVEGLLEEADVAGRQATLRLNRDEPFVTDEGHYIIDLHLRRIGAPERLAALLARVPGVVETGLFLNVADTIVVGREDGGSDVISKDEDGTDGDGPKGRDDEGLFDDIV